MTGFHSFIRFIEIIWCACAEESNWKIENKYIINKIAFSVEMLFARRRVKLHVWLVILSFVHMPLDTHRLQHIHRGEGVVKRRSVLVYISTVFFKPKVRDA